MAVRPCAALVIAHMLRRVLKDRSGATAIEMGFLATLIAVAIISSLHTFSNQLNNTFFRAAKEVVVNPQ